MTNWHVILNPTAGSGKAGRMWPKLALLFDDAGISFRLSTTKHALDATGLVMEAVRRGDRHFISIGGDGTHHEVINGFMYTPNHREVTVAIIPIGTGNDWARSLGIPSDPTAALECIVQGHSQTHSCGRITFDEDRVVYFNNVAGMGLDAEVVSLLSRNLVRRLGKMSYPIAAVRALISHRPYHVNIKTDDGSRSERVVMMHIGHGRFCGGGMEFLPQAKFTEGAFGLTLTRPANKFRMLMNMPRLYNGTVFKFNRITGHSVKHMKVEHTETRPIPLEADGEFIGFSPFEISAIPDAFRVVIP